MEPAVIAFISLLDSIETRLPSILTQLTHIHGQKPSIPIEIAFPYSISVIKASFIEASPFRECFLQIFLSAISTFTILYQTFHLIIGFEFEINHLLILVVTIRLLVCIVLTRRHHHNLFSISKGERE